MRSPHLYCAIPGHRVCARLPLLYREGHAYFMLAGPVDGNCTIHFSETEILARGCQLWRVPDRWERQDPHTALYLHQNCFWHLGPLEYVGPYLGSHQFYKLPFDGRPGVVAVADSDRIKSQCEQWARLLLQMRVKLGVLAERSAESIQVGLSLAVSETTKKGFQSLYRQLPRPETELVAQGNVD